MIGADLWATAPEALLRRELYEFDAPAVGWPRVVALLNVWNDAEALRAYAHTWVPFVDVIHAVDGAYRGVPGARFARSMDGTLEVLDELATMAGVTVRHWTRDGNDYWPDQVTKRNTYWSPCKAGDLCVIVDADEEWWGLDMLQRAPELDVGWVRYITPGLYHRPQDIPRVFRYVPGMRHTHRHHWVIYPGGDVNTNQGGAPGRLHRLLPVGFTNHRDATRSPVRQAQAKMHRQHQALVEVLAAPEGGQTWGHEPLRVLQLGRIDPGGVSYRLHTALNACTPHQSVQATEELEWPAWPRQLAGIRTHLDVLRRLASQADVIHLHADYWGLDMMRLESPRPLVIHHHGTALRRNPEAFRQADAQTGALRLVSNLELLRYAPDAHWLPNPVPVALYQRLALQALSRANDGAEMVVAHSPTKPELKGTAEFLAGCELAEAEGVPVRPLVITRRTIVDALTMKAGAYVFFDSFDLGIQCSGLEAAAMGMPVLAGDAYVRDQYVQTLGECPYTYVQDAADLATWLVRLWRDQELWLSETRRVEAYVRRYHDLPEVAARYLDYLDGRFEWRKALDVNRPHRVPLRV